MESQTDPAFYGWAFSFPINEGADPEWRQLYFESWKRWLAQWNPPQEWMQ